MGRSRTVLIEEPLSDVSDLELISEFTIVDVMTCGDCSTVAWPTAEWMITPMTITMPIVATGEEVVVATLVSSVCPYCLEEYEEDLI